MSWCGAFAVDVGFASVVYLEFGDVSSESIAFISWGRRRPVRIFDIVVIDIDDFPCLHVLPSFQYSFRVTVLVRVDIINAQIPRLIPWF